MDKEYLEKWIMGEIDCFECEYLEICKKIMDLHGELNDYGLWHPKFRSASGLCVTLALVGNVKWKGRNRYG